jgi:hypothetical protein
MVYQRFKKEEFKTKEAFPVIPEKEKREKERISEEVERPKEERKEIPEEISLKPLPAPPPVPKAPLQNEIEDILEEGLEGIYHSLDPATQKEFKEKGEETAFKISILIRQAKIKIRQILKLIIEWLKLIPGINKFFLEQEAKIKTDKILRLRE